MLPLTVRALLDAYLVHAQAIGLHTPHCRAERVYVFDLFKARHGDDMAAEMKAFQLEDFIEANPKWCSVSTKRAKANYIRAAFRWAADTERIHRHPFVAIRYGEAERRPNFPDPVMSQLTAIANKPYERAVRWLRLTGCRLSELCRARWDQIDRENGVWRIGLKHKGAKKTQRIKVVALVADAVALLEEIEAQYLPGLRPELIFLNNRGTAWNRGTLGQQLRRMKARHGIQTEATLHGLRHQQISVSVSNGGNIKMVAEQAGHASVVMIERWYYHPTPQAVEEMRKAAEMGLPKRGAQ